MMWLSKSSFFLVFFAVAFTHSCHTQAFKFQTEEDEASGPVYEVPEYEEHLPEEKSETVRDQKTIDLLVPVEDVLIPVEDVLPHEEREDEQEPAQPEGRFFLKDKLCALGLADVRNIDNIQ